MNKEEFFNAINEAILSCPKEFKPNTVVVSYSIYVDVFGEKAFNKEYLFCRKHSLIIKPDIEVPNDDTFYLIDE